MARPFRESSPTRSLKPQYMLNDILMSQMGSGKLTLADMGFADDGCGLIGQSEPHPGLTSVDLRGNRITSPGLIEVIKFVSKCGNVENLALNWNDLENDSEDGMNALARFMQDGGTCQVKYLDLRNSNLSMNSKDALIGILRSPSLRFLDLSWNSFNDTIIPELLKAIGNRNAGLQLELKGTGISAPMLTQVSEGLKALGARFPAASERRFESEKILLDSEGKKRLLLDNLYNQERLKKIVQDTGRVILNPETAEIEILMGEMIKKKLLAKDRVLRELDERLKALQELDGEMQDMAVVRDRFSNDNLVLKRELEMRKTEYSKTKQNFQIEQENLTAQLKSLQACLNKRDIDHRSLVDRLINEQRIRAKNFGDQLQAREMHLVEKIKSLSLDNERMDKDISHCKGKMVGFMQNFNLELRRKEEQIRLEERARAEWSGRLIEARILSATEGNDMMQRRGVDELKCLMESEDHLMGRIESLRQETSSKKDILHSLDEAVKTVQVNNDRLLQEEISLDGAIHKLKDCVAEVVEEIRRKQDLVNNTHEVCEETIAKLNEQISSNRRSHEGRIEELEATLRKLKVECENISMRREYMIDATNRRVSTVIYETLGKYDK